MSSSARRIFNIVTTVVMVAIAVLILSILTILIVRNLSPKADGSLETDIRPQAADTAAPESPEPKPAKTPEPDKADAAPAIPEADVTVETDEEDSGEENAAGDADDDGDTGISEDEVTEADDAEPGETDGEDAETDETETEEAQAGPDADNESETTAETEQQDNEIQSAINSIAAKYGAAGIQVAVIKNGGIAGTYVYGDAVKGSRPMTDDSKIRVASVSKVILTMAVMRLCELGRLDIDADIGGYWGGTVRNPNHRDVPITMRQILSHTSSIIVYDYGFSADGELVRRRFLDGSCFGRSTPGSINSWNYNNYAFAALGLTVEVALDETVNALASRYLFAPLGIDAAFGSGSISDTENIVTLYTSNGSVGRSADAQRGTPGSTYPGERGEEFPGGLTISARDLAKLIATLAGGGQYGGVRLLSPESVSLMESSQGRTGGFEQCLPLRHRTNIYGESELYYHTGSNYGVYNLISYNPVTGDGVVVLTSGASGSTDSYGIYAVCGEISEYIYRNYR